MRKVRRDRLAFVLVAAYALGLGACRHVEEPGSHYYGSLKDDPVSMSAASHPRKVAAAARPAQPARSVRAASASAMVVAEPPAQPAPSVTEAPASSALATASSDNSAAFSDRSRQAVVSAGDDVAAVRMLTEGEALFDAGKVVQARRLFMAAPNGPVPDVVLALARSFDTYYLSRLPSSDAPPDMQRALVLYERAMERGAINAAGDLERTRTILKIPR